MPAQEARISDDRHQQHHNAESDLHPTGKPWWIDEIDQVMRDESAAVASLSRTVAQVVLQQRQRTGEANELDRGAVHHCRNVRPQNRWPLPGEIDATHNENDEKQMYNHH